MKNTDSPRHCTFCDGYGNHHTDKHFEFVPAKDMTAPTDEWGSTAGFDEGEDVAFLRELSNGNAAYGAEVVQINTLGVGGTSIIKITSLPSWDPSTEPEWDENDEMVEKEVDYLDLPVGSFALVNNCHLYNQREQDLGYLDI